MPTSNPAQIVALPANANELAVAVKTLTGLDTPAERVINLDNGTQSVVAGCFNSDPHMLTVTYWPPRPVNSRRGGMTGPRFEVVRGVLAGGCTAPQEAETLEGAIALAMNAPLDEVY